jgi:dienelactone hydrolase
MLSIPRALFAVLLLLTLQLSTFAGTREEFLKILDRPKVALNAETHVLGTTNGLLYEHFNYSSEPTLRVPGILLRAENAPGKLPVIISAHGTGGNKEGMLGMLRKHAQAGFLAVAIDGRFAGERTTASGTRDYNAAIAHAFQTGEGHPFYYDTVWDLMRLIDWLSTRPDVDTHKIGLIGISKGGIETYLTAAADSRVAVAVPCIGVQSFNWALEHDAWKPRVGTIPEAFSTAAKSVGVEKPDAAFVKTFYDKVVPGIYNRFDGPAMLRLIAPRPLLVINGDSDDKTPIPGLELCAAAARDAYAKRDASDRFILRVQKDTAHKVTDDSQAEALAWFAKWLKN